MSVDSAPDAVEQNASPLRQAGDVKGEPGLRPATLAEYVGQQAVRENLDVAMKAALGRNEPLDHVLLMGPPGLGKTSLAHIIATQMGGHLHASSGPAIEKAGDLAAILTSLEPGDVLFIDEIHRLGKAIEEILYPAMEDYALSWMTGKGLGAQSISLKVEPFTLIGATTRYAMLSAPLRDRFGTVYRLDYYAGAAMEATGTPPGRLLAALAAVEAIWRSMQPCSDRLTSVSPGGARKPESGGRGARESGHVGKCSASPAVPRSQCAAPQKPEGGRGCRL